MENVLSIFFCLSLFYLSVTSRVKDYISVLRIQGIILTALLIFPFINNFSIYALLVPVSLFLIKAILIPWRMNKIVNQLEINRLIEPTIQQFNFLLIVTTSMMLIFVASNALSKTTELAVIPFASGFFAIIVGIFVIMFRRKLIIHVAGFLVMENGIFLISTAIAAELPVMIEIGLLLDIFVVVFLMGIALNRIKSTLSGFDVTAIRRLKD
jgi:hydrogenase-4 component E